MAHKISRIIEYRPGAGGRRVAKKRFYFGSREFTPEEARQTAKKLLASVALGDDPMKDRIHERQSLTFSEFAERYLSEEAEPKLKPGTVTNYRIAIRKHANPDIGRIKLEQISTSDLSDLHQKIGTKKPMTANRVMECISSIFRFAATSLTCFACRAAIISSPAKERYRSSLQQNMAPSLHQQRVHAVK
jgi:hypothetical protein